MDKQAFERLAAHLMGGWHEFMTHAFIALRHNGISGDYLEFGSFGGTTLWLAHQQVADFGPPRHMWAFDSFAGLPEADDARDKHPAWIAGTMAQGIDAFHAVLDEREVPRDAYTTVVGFYADTLPAMSDDDAPTDVALAFVDCDMYSSTVHVLEFLRPRLKHGMILAFDDYHCWAPDQAAGERMALADFAATTPEWRFVPYRPFGWGGESFFVEATSLAPTNPLR